VIVINAVGEGYGVEELTKAAIRAALTDVGIDIRGFSEARAVVLEIGGLFFPIAVGMTAGGGAGYTNIVAVGRAAATEAIAALELDRVTARCARERTAQGVRNAHEPHGPQTTAAYPDGILTQ